MRWVSPFILPLGGEVLYLRGAAVLCGFFPFVCLFEFAGLSFYLPAEIFIELYVFVCVRVIQG
jgi:hypothetical protein